MFDHVVKNGHAVGGEIQARRAAMYRMRTSTPKRSVFVIFGIWSIESDHQFSM